MKKIIKSSLVYSGVILIMTSCFNQQRDFGSDRYSENIGYDFSNPEYGGLSRLTEVIEQEIPPGMVSVEGGVFVMGQTQQDVMGGVSNKPKNVHVQSFYIDDSEVSNKEYLIYLDWLAKVFPKDNPKYKHIYTAALPDTTVWRNPLGSDGNLPKTYLRHRAYENYPVVGVSWLQANDYCKWRTDRIAEKKLVDQGILKPLYNNGTVSVEGRNHFDIEVFEANPNLLFGGDKSIYTEYVTQPEEEFYENDSIISVSPNNSNNNKLNINRQSPTPDFRLPTEVEWEYAAKADVENRYYNTIRGRKKYAWLGESTRDEQNKYYAQHANFKQSNGDYSGIAGWSSDYGDITTPIRSFPPNAYGLYDMAGNVAEWVFDVYRPTIDTELNDFNYSRGNIYRKPKLDENGNVIVATFNDIVYDTLPNGKIVPSVLPGQIVKENITNNDVYLNPSYQQADNRDYANGDKASSIDYAESNDLRKRMYNSPILLPPTINEETGEVEYKYDDKPRTTLITNYSRVYKGGSWKDRAYWLDPSQRRYLEEYMSTNYIGFRCVVTMVGESHEKTRRSPFNISY
ncbi:gliding motility lipoprotein GldJ [Wenyingzhuangia sp. IMCC45467]